MKKQDLDLSTIDTVAACNKGFEVELKHPATNEPLGLYWTVLGSESDAFREFIKETLNTRIRKEAMAKKRGKDLEIRTMDEAEAETIDLLTVCSLGWRSGDKPTLKFSGEDLAFNVPNVRKVLQTLPWIRKQLDEAIGDLENFMKG